jgi:hypothetical protein
MGKMQMQDTPDSSVNLNQVSFQREMEQAHPLLLASRTGHCTTLLNKFWDHNWLLKDIMRPRFEEEIRYNNAQAVQQQLGGGAPPDDEAAGSSSAANNNPPTSDDGDDPVAVGVLKFVRNAQFAAQTMNVRSKNTDDNRERILNKENEVQGANDDDGGDYPETRTKLKRNWKSQVLTCNAVLRSWRGREGNQQARPDEFVQWNEPLQYPNPLMVNNPDKLRMYVVIGSVAQDVFGFSGSLIQLQVLESCNCANFTKRVFRAHAEVQL